MTLEATVILAFPSYRGRPGIFGECLSPWQFEGVNGKCSPRSFLLGRTWYKEFKQCLQRSALNSCVMVSPTGFGIVIA